MASPPASGQPGMRSRNNILKSMTKSSFPLNPLEMHLFSDIILVQHACRPHENLTFTFLQLQKVYSGKVS